MLLLCGADAVAQCPVPGMRQEPAQVNFVAIPAEPVIRHDRKRAEMTASVAASMGNAEKSGLTTIHTRLELIPSFQYLKMADGRTCVVMAEVKATWRITDMVIDIASEYEKGSCQYREVLTHESEHARFNREAFRDYAPRMEAHLKVAARDIRPVAAEGEPQHAMTAMTERLTQAGREVQSSYQAATAARHGAIDTQESYAAVTRRCPRW